MVKRLLLIAGAAAVVLVVAASATATSNVAKHSTRGTPAAAPFSQAWAQVPSTAAGRRAADVLVFGAEQDVNGFNTDLNCCSQLWGNWMGTQESTYGAFIQNQKGDYVNGVLSSASADKSGVTYTIRPNANWYWGGKKVPVTYKDFVYTLQQLDSPNNDIFSRVGYSNLNPTKFTHKGLKQVTFYWKTTNCSEDFPCGPFANWRTIFSGGGGLFPSFALQGLDFNKIWTNCVCGSDGQPVSDGPYYVSNYTKGQGTTLKANPYWYGPKPRLKEIDFKLITDTNTEVQAMRGGEVDAISPTFGINLAPLKNVPGITFTQMPGYFNEHLEFRELKGTSNVLTRAPWLRQAIALAIDRQGIIKTVYGELTGNTTPMNNMLYYSTESAYKSDFQRWNYNPAKAIAILKKHCTGGPAKPDPGNSAIWSCSGLSAKFRWSWTASNATRTNTEAIVQQELQTVGIGISAYPRPANVIFGPTGLPGGDFDIAEVAIITSGDPGDYYDTLRCGGANNWTGYCSTAASKLMQAGNAELDAAKRQLDFQKADALLAAQVPMLPLYQRPTPLIYKSNIVGMVNNPTTQGPFWNMQDWHWK